MYLIDLKESILNKQVSDNFLILKCSDNTFIAHSYVDAISKIKDVEIQYSDSLVSSDNMFNVGNTLNVFVVDEFNLCDYYPDQLNNNIVMCNKCSKKIQNELNSYIVDIPKLEQWQIKDYTKTKLPGLSDKFVDWLCDITNYNIYRLDNEITKLSLFPSQVQESICTNMYNDGMYSDLCTTTIFDLTNNLVRRNTSAIPEILASGLEIEPFVLLSVLVKQFRNIIGIQLDSRTTAQSLGISPKQFKALEYSCGHYSTDELIDIYSRLTLIDYKVKTGQLEQKYITKYIINCLQM